MKKFLSRIRIWTAALCGFILNINAFGLKFPKMCAPTYCCNGCPWSAFGCPAGASAFQMSVGKFPTMIVGMMLLIGACAGRVVCGFLCPFGLLQELLYKIPSKKITLPKWTRYIKYGVLLLLVFLLPFLMGQKQSGYIKLISVSTEINEDEQIYPVVTVSNPSSNDVHNPKIDFIMMDEKGQPVERETVSYNIQIKKGETVKLKGNPSLVANKKSIFEANSPNGIPEQTIPIRPLYFCKICPVGTLTATIPAAVSKNDYSTIFGVSSLRIALLIIFIVGMIFISRFFCRTFCPIGAFYGLTCKYALFKPTIDKSLCINCGKCSRTCPVGLDVPNEIGSAECLTCGDCIKGCPTKALKRAAVWNIPQKNKKKEDNDEKSQNT